MLLLLEGRGVGATGASGSGARPYGRSAGHGAGGGHCVGAPERGGRGSGAGWTRSVDL